MTSDFFIIEVGSYLFASVWQKNKSIYNGLWEAQNAKKPSSFFIINKPDLFRLGAAPLPPPPPLVSSLQLLFFIVESLHLFN